MCCDNTICVAGAHAPYGVLKPRKKFKTRSATLFDNIFFVDPTHLEKVLSDRAPSMRFSCKCVGKVATREIGYKRYISEAENEPCMLENERGSSTWRNVTHVLEKVRPHKDIPRKAIFHITIAVAT